jgi:hypothetical protein
MKFSMDSHFIYITVRAYEHKQQLQCYYKFSEDELEDITKEWSVDLLVPMDPAEISNVDSPETATNIPRPSKTKETEEVHDLDNASVKTTSILAEKGRDRWHISGTEERRSYTA